MKNLIILVLIVGGVYIIKPDLFSFSTQKGAFDEEGNPLTLVFTHEKCGKPCTDTVKLLKQRRVEFSLHPLDNNETNQDLWAEYGRVNTFPNVIVGNERAYGFYKDRIVSALAMNYGNNVLSSSERYYMNKHFNDDGSNRLVMYSASWCGYCKKIRETLTDNDVDFLEIDVEKSSQRKAMTSTLGISGYPLVYFGYKRMEGPRPKDVMTLF